MKTKRTKNYPDFDLPCDVCGRRFKTPQGLCGHKQFKHNGSSPGPSAGPSAGSGPADGPGPGDPSVKDLKGEVERLELEVKKRKLQAEFPSPAGPKDLMESAGLGSIEGEAKRLAQLRVLGITDQGPAQSWIDKLLANPAGMRIAIDGLKGILGTGQNTGGDGTATLLKDLGFNLKDLILASTSPKAGTLSVAGLDLTGASLTPELLTALIAFKATTEAAEKEYQGKKMMSDTLKSALEMLVPVVNERLAAGPGKSISQKIPGQSLPIVDDILTCPKCGTENPVPADLAPGQKIKCQGEGCLESWLAVDEQAKPKPERVKRPVKVKEPEPLTEPCPGCGQLLDVTLRTIGEEVRCPVCDQEWTLISGSEAIKAVEPLTDQEKRQQEFLHR